MTVQEDLLYQAETADRAQLRESYYTTEDQERGNRHFRTTRYLPSSPHQIDDRKTLLRLVEGGDVVDDRLLDLLLELGRHLAATDLLEEVLLLGNKVSLEGGVPGDDVLDGQGVEETYRARGGGGSSANKSARGARETLQAAQSHAVKRKTNR